MYPNVHCTTIYNSQDMETNLSIDRWMDKEDVVCMYIYIYIEYIVIEYYSAIKRSETNL